jgi:nucleoside-diphosphate-sugar epimerase
MNNHQKYILVTGASGFLGIEVCKLLQKAGHKLVVIRHQAAPAGEVRIHTADISKIDELETAFQAYPIQTIIHLASILTTNSNQNPDLAFRVNVLGSNNLMECAQKYKVKRFIYSSTYSLIGYRPLEDCPVDESIAPRPCNFYGETKKFVEAMGISYARKLGFEFAAGRMGAVVGPGNALSTSAWRMDIFNLLKTGGKIAFKFAPQVQLPISEVVDTARALVTLATAEKVAHPIYHLPNDSLRVEEIAAMVKSLREDIEFSYGTFTEVDMPPLLSSDLFYNEFPDFSHIPLIESLRKYQQLNKKKGE